MFAKLRRELTAVANGTTWILMNAIGASQEKQHLEDRIVSANDAASVANEAISDAWYALKKLAQDKAVLDDHWTLADSIIWFFGVCESEAASREETLAREVTTLKEQATVARLSAEHRFKNMIGAISNAERAKHELEQCQKLVTLRDADLKSAHQLRQDLLKDNRFYAEQLRQCMEIAERFLSHDKNDPSDIPTFILNAFTALSNEAKQAQREFERCEKLASQLVFLPKDELHGHQLMEAAFSALNKEREGLAIERNAAWDALKAAGVAIPGEEVEPDVTIANDEAVVKPSVPHIKAVANGKAKKTPPAGEATSYSPCSAFDLDRRDCMLCDMETGPDTRSGATVPDCYRGKLSKIPDAVINEVKAEIATCTPPTRFEYQACLNGDLPKCWKCLFFPAHASSTDLGQLPKSCYAGEISKR